MRFRKEMMRLPLMREITVAVTLRQTAILCLKKRLTTGFSCQKEAEKKIEKKGKKRLTFWNTFAIIILALKNRAWLLKKS